MPIDDEGVDAEELRNPIVAVGCPRSGTTVLARIIASSSRVCYLEEQGIVERYLELVANGGPDGNARQSWLRTCAAEIVKHAKLGAFDLLPSGRLTERYDITLGPEDEVVVDRLVGKYEQILRTAPERLLRTVLADFSRLARRPRVLEKTPTHFLNLAPLRRIFPEARVCHITRDVRDVAASYVHPSFDVPKARDPIAHICQLHRTALEVDRRMRESGDPLYLSLGYGDLMADPVGTARRIYDFLELPWEPQLASLLKDVHPVESKWLLLSAKEQDRIAQSIAGARALAIEIPGPGA